MRVISHSSKPLSEWICFDSSSVFFVFWAVVVVVVVEEQIPENMLVYSMYVLLRRQ